MRSEEEMEALILSVARTDERIRAVGMNGSRVNPTVRKDKLQDYDIVYFVAEMDSFIKDASWVDVFGERIIMQMPEAMTLFPPTLKDCFTYLMLFTDGNRIDLILRPVEHIEQWIQEDRLAAVLLDKDQLMPQLPPPSDSIFWIERLTQATYTDCCNEFWWLTTYVAKGLWRGEVIYAYTHLQYVRDMFLKMIEWKVGIQTDFTISIGKHAKYLQPHIELGLWEALIASYPRCDHGEIWQALHLLIANFEVVAEEVASAFDFDDVEETEKVKQYLQREYEV